MGKSLTDFESGLKYVTTYCNQLSLIQWLLRGFFIGDEDFDLVEGLLGASRGRGSSGRRLGVGGACMGAGNVDLFASATWWFGVGKVCDEDYSFAGQHCQERKTL